MAQTPTACPMCGTYLEVDDILEHMLAHHPLTVAMWMTMMYPDADAQFFAPPEADDTYEYLSELCETMGNVPVGVSDIDHSAPVVICDPVACGDCPICLEKVSEAAQLRRIRDCRHIFCGGCIERWLTEHKTCPVCKNELGDEATTSKPPVHEVTNETITSHVDDVD